MHRNNEALASRLKYDCQEKQNLIAKILEKVRDSSEDKFMYIRSN